MPKNIFKFIFYLLLVLCILPGKSFGQAFKVYYCMGNLTEPEQRVMKKLGIPQAPIFGIPQIDPNRTGKIDSIHFVKSIEEVYPQPDSKGFGLLELEDNNWVAIAHGSADGVSFEEGLTQMLRLIKIAKATRPNVTWSIYNIPYVQYWKKNDDWKNQAERLKPLFDMVDVLAPSMYDFYADTTRFSDDKSYVEDNIGLALKIGHDLNKPVVPYIWHRWHDSNPNLGLQVIYPNEFKLHIQRMLKANYKGTMVSGFIWFGAQSYFYKIKPELAALDRKRVKAPVGKEKETVLNVYGNYLMETIKSERKK